MAAIIMPSYGGDDLYLYMREIVEEEFPKALRQACKPFLDSFHWSTVLVSKPLEKMDFSEMCFIMTHTMFRRVPDMPPYLTYDKPWHARNPEMSYIVDPRRRESAIHKLCGLKEQYVNIKGSTSPQLLRQQLAQAKGAFMALGVTLNDSRNAIDFSAAGLQNLIPESVPESLAASPFYSIFTSGYLRDFRASFEQDTRDPNIWIKGKYLGGGNFGKVFSFTHRESGIKVAMKEVKMEPRYSKIPEAEEVKQLQNEIDKLSRLRHPRIVRFHGSEQKGDVIYLFLDFMAGGSLHDFIRQRGKLDEKVTRTFTQQILEGVDYLHSNDITHRDIKGPNILLDCNRFVKLADFGVSKNIQKIGTKTDLKSYVGTTYWMAPEILWGKGYGRKVDICVGCTVVEMLTGDPPLKDLEPQAAMFRIGNEPLKVEEELPGSTAEEARDFVRAALTWKPAERPNCKELLTHAFVSGPLFGPADLDMKGYMPL